MNEYGNNLPKHLDVFKEIGNIGAGNAASALGRLLGREIRMTVPESDVVPSRKVFSMFSCPESLTASVLVEISNDLNGFILLVLDMNEAMTMICGALNEPVRILDENNFELSAKEQDTLVEISNIVVGSFISAISELTGLNIRPSVPLVTVDMFASIITVATAEYLQIGDDVLFFKTQFSERDGESTGHFLLIPDYSSYKILLNSLGLER